ncbi:MAG TPA: heme-binding domain-containing protein [Flavobacteriales bacterium]|nr:heme-binding domain-containing protein [Flavobacteriales bacterium]
MKKFLYILAAVILLAQIIRPSKVAEPVDPASDLIAQTKPTAELEGLLRVACYDCHSGQPRYPWYANITPVNWWLAQHITDGRKHFDATTWGTVPAYQRDHQAKEVMEMMEKKEMPLDSYTWTHADARLTDAQRKQISDFFAGKRDGSWDVEKARRKAAGEIK